MKAMIFAAGLGSRLKNETSDKPKALVEVGGKTLLQHAIEKVKTAGISEIVINVHHFADLIIRFIAANNFGIPIHISDETGKLLETGGGLKKAKHFLEDSSTVLIYNVDILSNVDLSVVESVHQKSGALATLVVRKRETQRYLKFNKEQQLVGWVNKKNGETKISQPKDFENARELAFSGIHFVQSEIFNYMPEKDRFSIIDLYLELAKSYNIRGFFDKSEWWMDVGKPGQLEEARRYFEH